MIFLCDFCDIFGRTFLQFKVVTENEEMEGDGIFSSWAGGKKQEKELNSNQKLCFKNKMRSEGLL